MLKQALACTITASYSKSRDEEKCDNYGREGLEEYLSHGILGEAGCIFERFTKGKIFSLPSLVTWASVQEKCKFKTESVSCLEEDYF